MIHIIRTKYLGHTNYKGPRIRATRVSNGETIVESFDYGASDPYALVADKLVTNLMASGRIQRPVECIGSNSDGKGYQLFVYKVVG
jgi:hypothetical protein